MIKNMEKVYLVGEMVNNMRVNGLMENSMEKDLLFYLLEKERKEFGKMVKELNGLILEIKMISDTLYQ